VQNFITYETEMAVHVRYLPMAILKEIMEHNQYIFVDKTDNKMSLSSEIILITVINKPQLTEHIQW
jgi:hypothetical protein